MADPSKTKPPVTIEPLDEEPWVRLANGDELADWEHQDEVAYNQQNRQMEKYRFFVRTFDYLNDNWTPGDYHEFGCHRVRTFRMTSADTNSPSCRRLRYCRLSRSHRTD